MNCRAWICVTASAISIGAASLAVVQGSPQRDAVELTSDEGSSLVKTRCLECHGVDLIDQQRLSIDGWSREIDKMTGWGARISDAERPSLAQYLARRYGEAGGAPSPTLPPGQGKNVLEGRCLTCHEMALIAQQRLGAEAWSREVDKMTEWGAVLTPEEKAVLVEYLSTTFR